MSAPNTDRAKRNILIVDNDPQLRRAFRRILTREYIVTDAPGGDEAIEEIKTHCPDLILLDINLPGIDGLEMCRRIRMFSDVLIIAVTVRRDEKDRVIALNLGADYMVKPFGTQELLARIRGALGRLPVPEEKAPSISRT